MAVKTRQAWCLSGHPGPAFCSAAVAQQHAQHVPESSAVGRAAAQPSHMRGGMQEPVSQKEKAAHLERRQREERRLWFALIAELEASGQQHLPKTDGGQLVIQQWRKQGGKASVSQAAREASPSLAASEQAARGRHAAPRPRLAESAHEALPLLHAQPSCCRTRALKTLALLQARRKSGGSVASLAAAAAAVTEGQARDWLHPQSCRTDAALCYHAPRVLKGRRARAGCWASAAGVLGLLACL